MMGSKAVMESTMMMGQLGWVETEPGRREGHSAALPHCMFTFAGGMAGNRDGEYVSTSTLCSLYCLEQRGKDYVVRSHISRPSVL